MDTNRYRLSSLADLERLYGKAVRGARKETNHIAAEFKEFIEKAPFMVLATAGADGLDASAKGDAGGFVKVFDEKTLLIPERGGKGRNDSLRNIVTNPQVALIFLMPGVADMIRVSGSAYVSIDPQLLAEFSMTAKPPQSVIVVTVDEAFFQCSRAIESSGLWLNR